MSMELFKQVESPEPLKHLEEVPKKQEIQKTPEDYNKLLGDITRYLGQCISSEKKLKAQIAQLELIGAPWPKGLSEKQQALNEGKNVLFELQKIMTKQRGVFDGMQDVQDKYQKVIGSMSDIGAL